MAHKHGTTSSSKAQAETKGEPMGARTPSGEPCQVCGLRDARALVMVELSSGTSVSLCANHELMYLRSDRAAATVEELRASLRERRDTDRRAGRGEVDELAASLSAAFTTERRAVDRRA